MRTFAATVLLHDLATTSVEAATTKKPTTLKPTTVKPTTKKPTTVKPTTMKPSTKNPTTMKPTTKKPTTMKPTTKKPTTMKPTTKKPTTMKPTTMKPTTMKPTTMKPTDTTTPEPITDGTTFDPVTSPEPITDGTTFDPISSPEPITDATTFDPATETTINPETTTLEPFSVSPATDYCNINTCSVPTDNTLCKYTNTTWGDACQPAYPDKSIVTDADIVTILAAHNDYRRKIAQGLETQGNPGPQPPASNMRELKWDQELAVMAAAHAQQCVFQHDSCRNLVFKLVRIFTLARLPPTNLGTSDWNAAAVTEWYNEVQNMDATYAASFPASPPKVIGHYTQVVWADTYLVGCAVAYYQSTTDFGPEIPYNRLYVCNYGPTGNWVGSPVYSEGTAGSACPSDTANNDGLCA
ncbi:hypothetical protein DAPPUDRAFT_312473 [Daphnia pulex]|uniref:SCP domain-containing protein n=1 Tax=Daphnia pulex TaxID=6669 RepID=E9G0Y7_DAPPU|nr:hypothetical protein DAPPUDRAFT_312473 [Daphnia pulex]|eukprot:EFX86988.1 hypothetical protein DAPPUDRAFT_312473 [Daphnia pulex]